MAIYKVFYVEKKNYKIIVMASFRKKKIEEYMNRTFALKFFFFLFAVNSYCDDDDSAIYI